LKDFIGILEGRSLREGDPILLASHIGGRKLHLLVEKVSLLFLEDLAKILSRQRRQEAIVV
jgi:hypothetical protein